MDNNGIGLVFANVALGFSIIFALIQCMFGYRLQRVMAAITGFMAGGSIGFIVAMIFLPQSDHMITIGVIIAFVVAIIGGIIAFSLYKVGVFIYMFFTAFSLVYNVFEIVKSDGSLDNYQDRVSDLMENILKGQFAQIDWLAMITSIIIGILVGILTLMFLRNVMIFTTALSGAASMTNAVFIGIFGYSNGWWMAVSIVALTAFGCVFQFLTTEKYKRKKH